MHLKWSKFLKEYGTISLSSDQLVSKDQHHITHRCLPTFNKIVSLSSIKNRLVKKLVNVSVQSRDRRQV